MRYDRFVEASLAATAAGAAPLAHSWASVDDALADDVRAPDESVEARAASTSGRHVTACVLSWTSRINHTGGSALSTPALTNWLTQRVWLRARFDGELGARGRRVRVS